jgi:hypothetical protein
MGGKLSRAKRACVSSNTTGVTGAGVNISKTYDTSCVQNMLKK